jgi:hypothetical protein
MPTLDAFQAPRGQAWWTPDSRAFASIGKRFELWSAKLAVQSIGDVVRKRVPWRVDENGALERIRDGKISGRVTRDGAPVAGIKIELHGRAPADMTDKPVGWESMKAKDFRDVTTTDADGNFTFKRLEVGELEYRVTAFDGAHRKEVPMSAALPDDDVTLPLELH